jgi:cell division protein FtsW (lipid II flippase)
MRCNNTNNHQKVNNLLLYTVAGTLTVPLVAALFVPAIYLPLVGLTIPFITGAFLEHKVEALGCTA